MLGLMGACLAGQSRFPNFKSKGHTIAVSHAERAGPWLNATSFLDFCDQTCRNTAPVATRRATTRKILNFDLAFASDLSLAVTYVPRSDLKA